MPSRARSTDGAFARVVVHVHTLPVIAAAAATMTPSADNAPTTDASHKTSRNSGHNLVSIDASPRTQPIEADVRDRWVDLQTGLPLGMQIVGRAFLTCDRVASALPMSPPLAGSTSGLRCSCR